MTALVPFEQQLQLADAFCRSGLFGVRTRDQAIALMAICEAEGLHPAKAVQEYHIIQGRPALKADAMLARFQAAGGKVKWTSMTDQRVAGEFSHPQGGSVEIDWTIDMAKRAGLPWDCILSAEVFRHYKPDPEAYLKAAELFSLEPGQVMLVATHPSDLRSAAEAGLRTGYVHRALERGADNPKVPPAEDEFDLFANDFLDLATQLGA